jgi:hypothetical protein
MKNIISISLAILFCCGCATKIEPYLAYSEKSHPLNDTAIFSVLDQSMYGGDIIVGIVGIDGKKYTSKGIGSGFWVRTLPGQHEFEITYRFQYALGGNNTASYKESNVKVSVNMKPKYVYLAKPKIDGENISVLVQELPESAGYKLPIGAKGFNYQEVKPEF